MTRRVQILFGPPGTGKTTSLLSRVEEAMADGVEPERVAFLAFTRKAAEEARSRALSRFSGMTRDHLPWFRTIHSTAYALSGATREEVMRRSHYRELGAALGLTFEHDYDNGLLRERLPSELLGDRLMRVYGLARAACVGIREQYDTGCEPEVPWPAVRNFAAALDAFKRDRGLRDFADLLDVETAPLDVDLLVVDEAQDLTPHQWRYVRRVGADAPVVVIGGDDDQAIYDWAGADAGQMLRFRGERVVLPLSYRLPAAVKAVADRVLTSVAPRVEKTWTHRGAPGVYDVVSQPEDADLLNGRTWLLLARHRRHLDRLVAHCRRVGVVYQVDGIWSNTTEPVRAAVAYERLRAGHEVSVSDARLVASWVVDMARPDDGATSWDRMPWPWLPRQERPTWMDALTRLSADDREYIRDLRRNGESLSGPGRVVVSTVHGAKGGEAQDVLIVPDVARRVDVNSAAEHRVLYVAVTRASERLLMVRPSTMRHWKI